MRSRLLVILPMITLAVATVACGSGGGMAPVGTATIPPPRSLAATLEVITPEATFLVEPTAEATWTPRPAPMATPEGQKSQPAAKSQASAAKDANLRAGPGTTFAKTGAVKAGDPLAIVGKNVKGDWLKLASGAWIAAFLVKDAPAVPVVDEPAGAVQPTVVKAAAKASSIQAFTCVGGCATPPDPSCSIKGNVNSHGEKIYHEPGWRDYKKTDVKPDEGDRWFCTSEEARAAGFRPAQQ